jgi:predicted phosphatase
MAAHRATKRCIIVRGGGGGEAQRQVDTLHKYLKGLNMTISRDRSQTFQIVAKRDTWSVKDPRLRLENKNLLTIDPEEAFRYLGTKMGPWKGVIVPEILSVVRRVRKLSLKPCQKIELISKYLP